MCAPVTAAASSRSSRNSNARWWLCCMQKHCRNVLMAVLPILVLLAAVAAKLQWLSDETVVIGNLTVGTAITTHEGTFKLKRMSLTVGSSEPLVRDEIVEVEPIQPTALATQPGWSCGRHCWQSNMETSVQGTSSYSWHFRALGDDGRVCKLGPWHRLR